MCVQRVPAEHCGGCLEELCRVVWRMLLNYCLMHHWHEREASSGSALEAGAGEGRGRSASQSATLLRRLALGRQRLWADIQLRVRLFLQSVQLSQLALDQFFAVLELIDRCALSTAILVYEYLLELRFRDVSSHSSYSYTLCSASCLLTHLCSHHLFLFCSSIAFSKPIVCTSIRAYASLHCFALVVD